MISDAIRKKSPAVIPYITAGLPDIETTGKIIRSLTQAGAAAIEIGIPFSDPMADGPILQKASCRAIKAGFDMDELLDNLNTWTASVDIPLIIMSYINPLMRKGLPETLKQFNEKGVQGVIIPDMPSNGAEVFDLSTATGIDLIRLVAPTTTLERQKEVVSQCRGFVYAVSVKGVTGARKALPEEVMRQVETIKAMTDLPVCVGFGVSSAAQVKDLSDFAHGVIVGSYLMDKVMNALDPVAKAGEVLKLLTDVI